MNTTKSITIKQLDYIEVLQNKLEYNKYTILNLASEIKGERIQHYHQLTVQEASKLIKQLKELLEG